MSAVAKAMMRGAAWACATLLACPVLAQAPAGLSGSIGSDFPDGGSLHVTFSCEGGTAGTGSCIGTYKAALRDSFCSNTFSIVDRITLTGLNLSAPGPFSGSLTLANIDFSDIQYPDGTCGIRPEDHQDISFTFTGTWNGTSSTLVFPPFIDQDGRTDIFTGSIQSTGSPPVFPMVVTGNIGTTADITATIQYRPQDVGSSGSVYVFAVAPANIVLPGLMKDASDALPPLGYANPRNGLKDTAVACVLAQLTATGQLRAVSPSSLQAYVTGVLTAQGAAVTVLNGVPTVQIGGATFYVGYGPNATSMLSGGVNRNVVTAPGARESRPQAPQTGWWWNATEGGRGYSIEVQGNHIFYAAFLYDDAGRSNWYVATGTTSIDGSLFTGDLLAVANGQTLGGAYHAPGAARGVGPFTLAFSDASNGTMVWTGGTVAIERFNIVTNGVAAQPRANQPESGWWWNPAESGRGFFIEWQDGFADLAGYMYDDNGNPVWYLSVQPTPDIRAFSGNWWLYANGQALTAAYKPATRINDNVAPVTIQFTSATTATLTLPNGRTTALQRHRF